jgi:hypothetical protein
MSLNGIPISRRTVAMDMTITANGSYTLPRYAFIPHPALQQLSSGMVQGPNPGIQSADFATVPGIAMRPYPVPSMAGYGIRSVQLKQSP